MSEIKEAGYSHYAKDYRNYDESLGIKYTEEVLKHINQAAKCKTDEYLKLVDSSEIDEFYDVLKSKGWKSAIENLDDSRMENADRLPIGASKLVDISFLCQIQYLPEFNELKY